MHESEIEMKSNETFRCLHFRKNRHDLIGGILVFCGFSSLNFSFIPFHSLSLTQHTHTLTVQPFSLLKFAEKKITEKFHATKCCVYSRGEEGMRQTEKKSRRGSLNIVWFCLLLTCSLKEARAINRTIDS